jgi:hypothetical protein
MIYCLALLLVIPEIRSQIPVQVNKSYSNLRLKNLPVGADTLRFDSLSVIPKTFIIKDVADSAYSLNLIDAYLVWKIRPDRDSILITYRVFPYKLNAVTQRMNFDSIGYKFYAKPFSFGKNEETYSNNLFRQIHFFRKQPGCRCQFKFQFDIKWYAW